MTILSWLTLALVTAFCVGPVAWQGVTSIKPDPDLVRLPPLLPDAPTWQHYSNVARSSLGHDLFNSVVVAGATTVLAVFLGALCAFGLVRLPIRGKGIMLTLILSLSMFPPMAVVSPLYLLARAMDLRDTLTALVLVHTTYALPLAVWILTNFVKHIPVELYWAARVDGCTPVRAFWSVILPPARPGIAVAALLVFIFSWNEFLFALTLTATDRARTAPVAIALFPGLHEVPWGDMAAATLTVTAPVILLAVLFQRYIVAGLTAGSVKG